MTHPGQCPTPGCRGRATHMVYGVEPSLCEKCAYMVDLAATAAAARSSDSGGSGSKPADDDPHATPGEPREPE